jgi:nitrite reductase (NADH) small subunit
VNEWIEVGKVGEIPRQGARVIKSAEGNIAVFRTATDDVFALRDQCPHKGGPLSQGIVHGKRVTCPLHNWVIELADGQAVAPDQGCAGFYATRVDQGVVYIELNK